MIYISVYATNLYKIMTGKTVKASVTPSHPDVTCAVFLLCQELEVSDILEPATGRDYRVEFVKTPEHWPL